MVPQAHAQTAAKGDGSLHLIPCVTQTDPKTGKLVNECTFDHLVQLGQNVINAFFFIVTIVLLFMLLKAGFQYLTAGGSNPAVLQKAKSTFGKVALGLLLMLSGFLVINYIIENVVDPKVIDNPLDGK